MEGEVTCDDPQFMNMLETCLRMEIETTKGTLCGFKSERKEWQTKIQAQLQTRKELKERTTNVEENILILTASLNKQTKYINEMSNKIELVKLDLDSDYKVVKLECAQYENICNEYEKMWESYHARYEEFPLAKDRKVAKIKLEKLRIEKMVLEFKINETQKVWRQKQLVTWLRMRGKIVELACTISNNTKHQEKLKDFNKSIKDRKKELNVIEMELAAKLKREEEEKRDRALKLLEMPPPKINFAHMRKLCGYKPKTGLLDSWKRNDENSMDSLSVDTLVLEEMCLSEGNSIQVVQKTVIPVQEDPSFSYDRLTEPRGPSLDQEQREVEHMDTASEMDGKAASELIDAVEEEVEHRTEQELERLDQLSGVSKDKQTGHRGEDFAEEMDDPLAKRMRLMFDEVEPVSSPIKNLRIERKKSHSIDPSPCPKITKIETVRYNVSPIKNMEKKAALRRSQLIDQSPDPRVAKMSLTKKLDQNNPNPSSMFTPGHFNYSDNSDVSFCADNHIADLKADQISLYGGSVRDFCDCSNISMLNKDAEMDSVPKGNANAPSTSKTRHFPQFDFSNIMKHTTDRNNLF